MYAKNITTFLLNLVKDKQLQINLEDEIIRDTLICRDGQVVNPRIQQLLEQDVKPRPVVAVPRPCRGYKTRRVRERTAAIRDKLRRCVSRTLRRKDKSNHVA